MSDKLWCSVCLFIYPVDKRPLDYDELPLTIINGHLLCTEHSGFAGPNVPYRNWLKDNM